MEKNVYFFLFDLHVISSWQVKTIMLSHFEVRYKNVILLKSALTEKPVD